MSFVFEQQQPRFGLAVYGYGGFYRTRVDFFRLVELVEFAVRFEVFRADRGKVHKADRLFAVEVAANGKIIVVRLLQLFVLELRVVNYR